MVCRQNRRRWGLTRTGASSTARLAVRAGGAAAAITAIANPAPGWRLVHRPTPW